MENVRISIQVLFYYMKLWCNGHYHYTFYFEMIFLNASAPLIVSPPPPDYHSQHAVFLSSHPSQAHVATGDEHGFP